MDLVLSFLHLKYCFFFISNAVNPIEDRGNRDNRRNCGNNAEIVWKLCGKFNFKVRKSHLKQRKVLFKRGLERYCRSKNALEFDVEKDGKIVYIFFKDFAFN